MADRNQHPSRDDETRRAVFDRVDLQTAELEIVGSIYDGFAAAIMVTGQPRTVALTREYSDAVQLMALIERGRTALFALPGDGASLADHVYCPPGLNCPPIAEAASKPQGCGAIYAAAYDSIRKGAPGLSDATCAVIARSINMKAALSAQPHPRDEAPPVRGEIRTIDGNRCRFIERELEGDKWEVIGPVVEKETAAPVREEAQPTVLPTDETGQITKRFVIFTTPGEVPEKKGGWLKDEHLIDFLRAVMLHDGWKPGFRATVLELTSDNDLWASSASEYLEIHDDAIGPRRARKAWHAARDEHERIYKVAPTMKLGDEIDSYRRITAIAIPEAREAEKVRAAVADIAAERQRQIDVEGRKPAGDDGYRNGELAAAASAYAFSAATRTRYLTLDPVGFWPWPPEWFKPKDQRSDLVRAGALIVAEIERLDRAALQQEGQA